MKTAGKPLAIFARSSISDTAENWIAFKQSRPLVRDALIINLAHTNNSKATDRNQLHDKIYFLGSFKFFVKLYNIWVADSSQYEDFIFYHMLLEKKIDSLLIGSEC